MYIHLFFNLVISNKYNRKRNGIILFLTASSSLVIAMVNYFFCHFALSAYFLKGLFFAFIVWLFCSTAQRCVLKLEFSTICHVSSFFGSFSSRSWTDFFWLG